MEPATGLKRKLRGLHMMHISQWLKLGGAKLLSDSGIQNFPKRRV
jgi:hypothetical protein